MPTLVTLIAVAAWCGQPNISDWPAAKVDQCRQEIMQCLAKTPRNQDCFLNQTLADK